MLFILSTLFMLLALFIYMRYTSYTVFMELNTEVMEMPEQQLKASVQKSMRRQKKDMAKLIRISDKTYAKLQKVQRPRESYGEVADRAADALLEKEGASPEDGG
jgi:SMC interacting uncharacterized protein involved in chromosome segregation